VLSKKAKVAMAQADHTAGIELKNEALARYDRERNLFQRSPGSTSQQDVGLARATWEKQKAEEISKAQAIKVANVEQLQAETVLEFYQLRTPISGRIKTIYKRPNEAVKAFEPVLQVYTDDRVRVEGLLDQRFLDALRDAMKGKGVRVVIEVAPDRAPIATLSGHLQEVTSVAVSRDAKQIVSGSDDGSVLVWDPKGGRLPRSLQGLSPVAVKAVACTPASTAANLCIAGMRDGRGRIWDLDNDKAKPIELDSRHTGAIRCATFSPDGKFCVTGGEDREIRLWDAATGKMRERFPGGHGGFVTSVQFTPNSKLVSAGEDNALRFWTVGEKGAKWDKTIPGRRGGVNQLGVSSDGKRVLFDQARMIRILSLPDGNTEGELQSVADFSAFALFSPDGRLILTAGGSESGLQLWRAPHAGSRGYEIRQLVVEQESPTCAAFAPNGAFIVTGSRERHVLVWPVPAEQEVRQEIVAEAPRFDDLYEGTKRQRKIWAELANPGGRLTPGDTVTMVIYPLQ
ncbi:MAG TPA: HlyD family efflux transporter periplasmic adaptor subunit, partial [Gemmataceae bacterium]|nr:HlyD family efflux transporter periplasmic adaptor subunit [Gemmataceae bacterium]